jgi:tryptophan synthase alpha chain
MSAATLQEMFAAKRALGGTALLPFLTAGLPDPGHAVEMFKAMADAGADGFEVGIPYSDPLMDGPTIQEGGARALAAGVDLELGFEIAGRVATTTELPVLVMTYANVVVQAGPDEFAGRAADHGVSGLIVADLPLEEAGPVKKAAERAGLGMVLFAAPTTNEARLQRIAQAEPAFIYGVADLGVTGERVEASGRAGELAARIRAMTDLPLVMGVGISTPAHAEAIAGSADGVIVGSALVRRVLEASTPEEAAASLHEAVAAFRAVL